MFVIAFLSRSKSLLISWLHSPSAVILDPPKIKSVTVSIVSPSICREVKRKNMVPGEGTDKPLQYSCLDNPLKSMKTQKYRTLKNELPRLVGAQFTTGDQWINNSRKNEAMGPKQKQHPVLDVTGDGSKL